MEVSFAIIPLPIVPVVRMAYSDFTLESACRKLNITTRAADLFPNLEPATPPAWLQDTLARGTQEIHLSLISEKARSEFIVVPILLAGRELSGKQFAIYSGQRLDVDQEKGLTGECDFILAASEPTLPLRAPLVTVVEAKKNDIEGGLGQCIAQMVAADMFNRSAERNDFPIYGCVTSGTAWRFLRLSQSTLTMDLREFNITEVDRLLGILVSIAGPPPAVAA